MSPYRTAGFAICLWISIGASADFKVPKVWSERDLKEWATPLAGLNLRPTHISSKAYYAMKVENLRTYPVYFPGREPAGYWEMLQKTGPQPLIEADKLKTEADWIRAGQRVFDEVDFLHLRTMDAKYINEVRSREQMEASGIRPLKDGTLVGLRWVPTREGVALSSSNCSFCHTLNLPDGTRVPGAPFRTAAPRPPATFKVWPIISRVQMDKRVLVGSPPFLMGDEPVGMWLYRAYGVPWRKGDVNEKLKTATQAEYEAMDLAHRTSGGLVRWNGSLMFPAKIPDLIGIKERKYIDHTATHLHRNVGDLMRYAALVTSAEASEFGPHRMISAETKRTGMRLPDEALYALGLYIYSLEPPKNPNVVNEKSAQGQKVFEREGCVTCHTPPFYTNNKLTLAKGFEEPKNRSKTLDVLPLSVGTDPGLALETRKGTGYYKVPSLKGVWYRGRYLHDGSAASLEEMFDPGRIRDEHVPGGWTPLRIRNRAIPGHPFGLKLSQDEREQLIAFLRTL